jgi:hypothetical protein
MFEGREKFCWSTTPEGLSFRIHSEGWLMTLLDLTLALSYEEREEYPLL